VEIFSFIIVALLDLVSRPVSRPFKGIGC